MTDEGHSYNPPSVSQRGINKTNVTKEKLLTQLILVKVGEFHNHRSS